MGISRLYHTCFKETQNYGSVTDFSIGKAPFRFDYTNSLPTIAFAGDESTVTIANNQATLTFLRPVVTPWVFTPTGTTYYVKTTGSNGAAGTSIGAAFQTVAKFLSIYAPGDCCYILPGTYIEDLSSYVLMGTSGNVATLSCAKVSDGGGLGTVVLRQDPSVLSGNSFANILGTRQYSMVNGIMFHGCKGEPNVTGTTQQSGIVHGDSAGTGLSTVQNCVLYNLLDQGIRAETNAACKSNVIFGNGHTGLHHGIYVDSGGVVLNGNIVFSNMGAGLHFHNYPNTPSTATYNLSIGNEFWGLVCDSHNVAVNHNTFVYNWINLEMGGTADSTTLLNNILANPEHFNLTDSNSFSTPPGVNTDDYSCYYGAGDYSPFNSYGVLYFTIGAHSITSNPLFTAPTTGDFTLQGGSPAATMGCYT